MQPGPWPHLILPVHVGPQPETPHKHIKSHSMSRSPTSTFSGGATPALAGPLPCCMVFGLVRNWYSVWLLTNHRIREGTDMPLEYMAIRLTINGGQ